MKLQYLLVDNTEELNNAERLGLPEPELKHIKKTIVVDIYDIGYALITKENHIEIEVRGYFYLIEYDEYTWNTIIEAIEKREADKRSE